MLREIGLIPRHISLFELNEGTGESGAFYIRFENTEGHPLLHWISKHNAQMLIYNLTQLQGNNDGVVMRFQDISLGATSDLVVEKIDGKAMFTLTYTTSEERGKIEIPLEMGKVSPLIVKLRMIFSIAD
jgi:hypothetical protein